MIQQLLLAQSENLIGVDGAHFDGVNDGLVRTSNLAGMAVSKSGIFSCWAQFSGATTGYLLLGTTPVRCSLSYNGGGSLAQWMGGISGADILDHYTGNGVCPMSTAGWHHILLAWDQNNLAASPQVYVDDVSITSGLIITNTNFNLGYDDPTNWGVGCNASATPTLTYPHNGGLAEYYFAPGQWLDMTVTTNRRKFISQTLRPVSLGATGALPTGTAPIIYLHLDNGEAVANFATNRGTGGDFTIVGTLTTSSTSPSD